MILEHRRIKATAMIALFAGCVFYASSTEAAVTSGNRPWAQATGTLPSVIYRGRNFNSKLTVTMKKNPVSCKLTVRLKAKNSTGTRTIKTWIYNFTPGQTSNTFTAVHRYASNRWLFSKNGQMWFEINAQTVGQDHKSYKARMLTNRINFKVAAPPKMATGLYTGIVTRRYWRGGRVITQKVKGRIVVASKNGGTYNFTYESGTCTFNKPINLTQSRRQSIRVTWTETGTNETGNAFAVLSKVGGKFVIRAQWREDGLLHTLKFTHR